MTQADSKNTTPTPAVSTRRRFLTQAAGIAAGAGLAAMAAASVPSTAFADPASGSVHAAIEAHKAAWAAYEVDVTSRLEAALPKDRRQSDYWEVFETDDPRWIEHGRTLEALSSAYDDASIALLNLEPATLAGLLMLVSYIADLERRGLESWPDVEEEGMRRATWDKCLLRLIADALGRIGGVGMVV